MNKPIVSSFSFPLEKEETMCRFEDLVAQRKMKKSKVIVELIERYVEEEKNGQAGVDLSPIKLTKPIDNIGNDPYKLIAVLDNWMMENKDNDDIKFFATVTAKTRELKDFTWSKYNTLQRKKPIQRVLL